MGLAPWLRGWVYGMTRTCVGGEREGRRVEGPEGRKRARVATSQPARCCACTRQGSLHHFIRKEHDPAMLTCADVDAWGHSQHVIDFQTCMKCKKDSNGRLTLPASLAPSLRPSLPFHTFLCKPTSLPSFLPPLLARSLHPFLPRSIPSSRSWPTAR